MRNNTGYAINHTEKTITITKAFAKAAGIYNSAEYNVLKGLKTDYFDYTIKQKEIAKSTSKKTYANLTYVNMRAYIEVQNDDANPVDSALRFAVPPSLGGLCCVCSKWGWLLILLPLLSALLQSSA